jgi:hypothetical protein
LNNENDSGTKPHQLNLHPHLALAKAVMLVDEDLSALILWSKTWDFESFHLCPG